jgi:hypothetical protein
MPAFAAAEGDVLITQGSYGNGCCSDQLLLNSLTLTANADPCWMMPASAAAAPIASSSKFDNISMGVTQLLQQSGPRTAALEALLQQELAELAGNQQRLNRVRNLLQQQQQQQGYEQPLQQAVAPAVAAAAPVSAARSSSNCQLAGKEPIRVLPLLGLTLSELVSHLQQQLQQQQSSANTRILPLDATPLLQSSGTPLAAALGDSGSAFLLALHSEVQRLRQLVAGCYVQLEETVAAIGQQLPPVQDSSSSEGGEAAAALVTAGRRSVRVSNSDGLTLSRQPSMDATAAAAQYAAEKRSSKLDMEFLQACAAAVSHDLVHLDDFVSNSTTQLAHLAIQYDTLLTAAAADCPASTAGKSSSSILAGNADAGVSRAGSLLGVLGKWQQSNKQQQQGGQKPARGKQQAVQFLLMTPGVCSHSSGQQASRYIAGGGWQPQCFHTHVQTAIGLLGVPAVELQKQALVNGWVCTAAARQAPTCTCCAQYMQQLRCRPSSTAVV